MLNKIIKWMKNIFTKTVNVEKVFTLEEYLDLVSQYTDSTILTEKSKGNSFTGGDCRTNIHGNKLVRFSIQMYFINNQNERTLKTSERTVLLDNFDLKSQKLLMENKKTFEIISPPGEK